MTDPLAPVEAALATARGLIAEQQAAAVAAAVKAQTDADASALAADELTIEDLKHRIEVLTQQVPPPVPPTRTVWGASVMPYPPEKPADALARVEQQLAPDLIRDFTPGTGGPIWPTDLGTHRLAISWKILPAQVVDGSHDAQITAWARGIPDHYTTEEPAYASYWHECEDDIERGTFTAAAYRAAWVHIASLIRQAGTPIRLVLILMEFTLRTPRRNWLDYYAGPNDVDVLGWDCYFRPGRDPADVYARPRAVSMAAGKPWAICETAVGASEVPDPRQRQALLTALARNAATVAPLPEFVSYFDSDPGGLPGFGWNISRDPAAAAAWRAGRTG